MSRASRQRRVRKTPAGWWRWPGRIAFVVLALATAGALVTYGPRIVTAGRSATSRDISIETIPADPRPADTSTTLLSENATGPAAALEPDPSDERLAVDALAEGRFDEAAARYQTLARQQPDDGALVQAAKVLARAATHGGHGP